MRMLGKSSTPAVLKPFGMGEKQNAITITHQEGKHLLAVSHFGEAVLTFHVPCLFNTPPGFDLFVTGPINRPKANIQPLTGVVETDWSPFSFTMNWMFTTPGERIVFEENEPIAAFFPIQRGVVESFEPVMKKPEDNAELWSAHMDWRESRTNFNQDLTKAGSDAQKQKWQKGYFGGPPSKVSPAHRTKLRLKDFSK